MVRSVSSGFTFYPVRISDFVTIGSGCIIEAAQIGHAVDIGKGSIIVSLSSTSPKAKAEIRWEGQVRYHQGLSGDPPWYYAA